MSDNGSPFVTWMPGVLTLFGKRLRDLEVRHIRTQVDSPWTNGKIEAFWATLKSEVSIASVLRSLADAETALERFARYYN
jgi:transposase InsO family protein